MPVRQSLRRLATFLLLALFGESRLMRACLCLCSLVLASQVWATPCDVDGDGDIDLDDLTLIQQAILARTPVSGPGDPRDADSNGVINSIDGRLCALRCTRPKCATTNSPPLANAGPDQSVPFGKLVSLDGSSSRDPEGATLTYNWSLIGRPAGSNAVLAAANSKNPTFTADRPGDYLAQLIVSDGQLSSVPDTVSITVTHNPPTVSLTAPAAGAVYTLPATVTLTATASGAEANTPISRVDFYQGTTLIGGGTASPYTIIWTPTIAGSYSLTAKATDSAGGVTTSAARSITVQAANQLPSVSLSSPVADQSFTAPANVTLTATASDADGTLAMVEFFQGATLIGSATTAPYSVVWSDVPVGSYSLTAKATDNLGGTRSSAAVPITVTPAGPTILYLHGDHLGTPRVATNESNVVVWRNLPTTEPFGMALPEEDPDGDGKATVINLRFPGQYFDRETQLHYNYFRDYDPGTGRYVQSDPIGLKGGINTYSYVGGNPLSFADPPGLCAPGDVMCNIANRAAGLPPSPSPCDEDDRCKHTITLTSRGVCDGQSGTCSAAMQAAGMVGPYYSDTKRYSISCLATLGLVGKTAVVKGGNYAASKAPQIAARAGMGEAGVAMVARGAALYTNPVSTAVGLGVAIPVLLEECECKK